MKFLKHPVGTVVYGILFALLFYHKSPGLNLLLFEIPLMLFIAAGNKQLFSKGPFGMVYFGTALLIIAFAIHGSTFTMAIHLLSLLTLTGMAIFPHAKTIFWPFLRGFFHLILTPFYMVQRYRETRINEKAKTLAQSTVRYVFVPLGAMMVFSALYAFANPIFSDGMTHGLSWISNSVFAIIPPLNIEFLILFIFGCCITSLFVFTEIGLKICSRMETGRSDQLSSSRSSNSLNRDKEYKMAIIILLVLNLLIAFMNISDIRFVWIDFTWTGEHLKTFVHEGTYALILSILISMALVVYFFRKDLNFYRKSKQLRLLANLWIIQNAILAISVMIRNYHYIHYFSLAYRRIGMVFFILLVIYGLFTVWIKINKQRSIFYLLRVNAASVYIALLIMALIPWDNVIAKYNLHNYNKGFVHLEFLATLSDKTLYTLEASDERLNEIKYIQDTKFDYEEDFISAEEYSAIIRTRQKAFDRKMERLHWLSYNLMEYLAWSRLSENIP